MSVPVTDPAFALGAAEIATITYRSGPEWEQRFGRRRRAPLPRSAFADPSSDAAPSTSASSSYTPPVLCPDFLIETYLDHQGESFCLKYDANSLIYISKAMDLFDMSADALQEIEDGRRIRAEEGSLIGESNEQRAILCELPEQQQQRSERPSKPTHISSLPSSLAPHFAALTEGLKNLSAIPTLVIGVQSDALFPFVQQRELAEALRQNGNKRVVYYELDSPMGHDSFLLDVASIQAALRGFL